MKSKGVASAADIFALSLLVVFACLLLIASSASHSREKLDAHAERTAQNIFLVLQEVSVQEFGNLSYIPNLSIENPSIRVLREKTINQLIAEGVLLNPEWEVDGVFLKEGTNSEYEKKLANFLDNLLGRIVDNRFGFRFIIRLETTELSENRVLRYRESICDFDEGSRKLCSESLSSVLVFPDQHQSLWSDRRSESPGLDRVFVPRMNFPSGGGGIVEYQNSLRSSPLEFGTLRLTLELWSR